MKKPIVTKGLVYSISPLFLLALGFLFAYLSNLKYSSNVNLDFTISYLFYIISFLSIASCGFCTFEIVYNKLLKNWYNKLPD